MNENYRCGDAEGLTAFVYGECDPAERDAMSVHVAGCASCAEEVESLRSTRTMLAAWTVPETSLGFRLTASDRLETRPETPVLRPAAWWRQPLPAWAQAAAAVLIFAAGLTAGGMWQQPAPAVADRIMTSSAPEPAAVVAQAPPDVSREDFIRLEQRLRAMESGSQAAVRPVSAALDEAALMRRVEMIVAESEQRQRTENAQLVEAVAKNMTAQRKVDLQQIDRWVGQMYRATDATLRQHNTALNALARVSLPQASGQ